MSRKDADNNKIENPLNSNNDYGEYNYTEFCGFYCSPTSGLDVI